MLKTVFDKNCLFPFIQRLRPWAENFNNVRICFHQAKIKYIKNDLSNLDKSSEVSGFYRPLHGSKTLATYARNGF